MANTLTETGFSQESFDAFNEGRNEPAWLTERRNAAWAKFSQMDWPARNAEEWIRTDIRLFKLDKFNLPIGDATATVDDAPPALLTTGVELGGYAASFDSRSVASHIESKWSDKGVIFGSLEKLVSEHSDLVEKYLMSSIDPEFDRFSALHAACWAGGAFLYVPKGVTVDEPMHMLSAMSDGGTDLGHNASISRWNVVSKVGAAKRGQDAFGGLEVLDGHRKAMQGPQRFTSGNLGICLFSLGKSPLGRHGHHGVDERVDLGHPI